MDYRQWQQRNSEKFNSLTEAQKQDARKKGYYNKGWNNVKNSWVIISRPIISIFEHQLNKGNIVGAINLLIIETDNSKQLAEDAIQELSQNQKSLNSLADKTLAKYQLL